MRQQARRSVQYTLRNVPRSVDLALRHKARERGKSLNETLLDIVTEATGVGRQELHNDLDHLIGSWIPDSATEQALDEQRSVDPRDWE